MAYQYSNLFQPGAHVDFDDNVSFPCLNGEAFYLNVAKHGELQDDKGTQIALNCKDLQKDKNTIKIAVSETGIAKLFDAAKNDQGESTFDFVNGAKDAAIYSMTLDVGEKCAASGEFAPTSGLHEEVGDGRLQARYANMEKLKERVKADNAEPETDGIDLMVG